MNASRPVNPPVPAAQRRAVRPTRAMEFPPELEDAAFRSANGEYAWQRSEALAAVRVLADRGRAVLGGELWLVRDGEVWGQLPQHSGPPAVYAWETERRPDETWPTYVARHVVRPSQSFKRGLAKRKSPRLLKPRCTTTSRGWIPRNDMQPAV